MLGPKLEPGARQGSGAFVGLAAKLALEAGVDGEPVARLGYSIDVYRVE